MCLGSVRSRVALQVAVQVALQRALQVAPQVALQVAPRRPTRRRTRPPTRRRTRRLPRRPTRRFVVRRPRPLRCVVKGSGRADYFSTTPPRGSWRSPTRGSAGLSARRRPGARRPPGVHPARRVRRAAAAGPAHRSACSWWSSDRCPAGGASCSWRQSAAALAQHLHARIDAGGVDTLVPLDAGSRSGSRSGSHSGSRSESRSESSSGSRSGSCSSRSTRAFAVRADLVDKGSADASYARRLLPHGALPHEVQEVCPC